MSASLDAASRKVGNAEAVEWDMPSVFYGQVRRVEITQNGVADFRQRRERARVRQSFHRHRAREFRCEGEAGALARRRVHDKVERRPQELDDGRTGRERVDANVTRARPARVAREDVERAQAHGRSRALAGAHRYDELRGVRVHLRLAAAPDATSENERTWPSKYVPSE